MKPAGQRAVIIFIDNSAMSIDGDFLPNRLAAQINTIERFAQYLFSENVSANSNPDGTYGNSSTNNYNVDYESMFDTRDASDLYSNDSLIAVGTLGSEEFGIRTSFTSNYLRLEKTLSTITSGGVPLLDRAIKLGFMALKHAPPTAQWKMMIFINSSELSILENSLDDKKVAELNKKILENKKIAVNFIVIGDNGSPAHFPSISNLQTPQNYSNSIPHIMPNNGNLQNAQNIPILQPNPLLQNMIQNQQFYMQNQTANQNDTTNSKSKKSRTKKNSTNNNDNSSCPLLQRITKKAKHASIMIIHTCSTILSDVVMANEIGLPLQPGSELIYGAPNNGNRKQNSTKANIRNSNSSISDILFEPGHNFDIGYGYDPRVGFNFSDMQLIESELKQPQIQSSIPLTLSTATLSPPGAVKKESKTQKIKTIVFQNSNMIDNQGASILNSSTSEPKPVKRTRGRKPQYSASCPANQMIPPISDNKFTIQQVMSLSYNNGIETYLNIDQNDPTREKNSKKTSLETSSSVSISSNLQSIPTISQASLLSNIPPIVLTTNRPKQRGSKAKTTRDGTKTEDDTCLSISSTRPTRQRKQRKPKNIEENIQ